MNSLMLFLTEYWSSFEMYNFMYIILYVYIYIYIVLCFLAGLFALVTGNLTIHSLVVVLSYFDCNFLVT